MRHRNRSRKVRGGNSHTIGVYGDMNEQTSQNGQGNLIASKGGSLTNIAVPAALYYANSMLGSSSASNKAFKNSSKKVGGGKKKKQSRRKSARKSRRRR